MSLESFPLITTVHAFPSLKVVTVSSSSVSSPHTTSLMHLEFSYGSRHFLVSAACHAIHRSPEPLFEGRRVVDFLDSLEAHAMTAHNNLPAYVLHYCHRRVRNIVNSSTHWIQHDWAAPQSYLIGSSDRKPKNSPDRLRKWVKVSLRSLPHRSVRVAQ
jgi:hypothetical protein